MNEKELREYLKAAYPEENEACDWKEFTNLKNAVSGSPGSDIESYVSAIANMKGGHLVIGVRDKTLDIIGIQNFHDYTPENIKSRLAGRCAHLNSEKLKVEVFKTDDTGKIVWVIHIPQHEPRLPVYAHGRPWQRIGDSLVQMRPERLNAILNEPLHQTDWSAVIVSDATLKDLDEKALVTAREKFKQRTVGKSWHSEIDHWDWATFLDKAKLTANGGITRACLLLLGKRTAAEHLLSPHPAQITWKLDSADRDYEHFGPPFILSTTEILNRIRNTRQKLFPTNQLLPVEIQKYDTRSILEALHNCIAHQDYERHERILVTEIPDRLIFENAGNFFEGKAEDYFKGTLTPKRYRNQWLVNAMAEVNMIDTLGYGIHEMTKSQLSRYLPLPDYSLSTATHVVLVVYGRPIDERYSQLLLQRGDLDIDTVILLDRVQKNLPITDEAVARLRRAGLIEGRRPNIRVAASVAEATGMQATYARSKGTDKADMKRVVLEYLDRFATATRPDLDNLLIPMMPAHLSETQGRNRVKNLLSEMSSKDGTIVSEGKGPGATWRRRDPKFRQL